MKLPAALLFVICLPCALAWSAPPCARHLKVGVVLPLTGGPVSSGEAVRNGILLAAERFDSGNCVEFIFEDDQLQPKMTVSAVQKLVETDRAGALIVYGTPTSLAVNAYTERSRIPLIALSILDKVVEGKNYVMKHWCTAERLHEAVSREVGKRGYKTIAVVSTVNDAMLKLRDLMVQERGPQIVLNEEFLKTDYDFRTIATRIREQRPAAVYVLLYPPQAAPFMKMLRESGFKGEAFGVHNLEDPAEVSASSGAMVGMWLANGDDSAGENYRADYEKRFSQKPSLGGANGFDAAKMLIESLQSGADLNDYLHRLADFSGAFGHYSAAPSNDFNIPAVIKEIRPEGFVKRG